MTRETLVAFVLLICAGTGATIAAALHAAPSAGFRAESVVAVSTINPAFQPIAWRTMTQVLALPEVRAAIADGANIEPSAVQVGTLGNPRSSLIKIYADGSSMSAAVQLTEQATAAALNFLRQTVYPTPVTRSRFDDSTEGWDLGNGIFVFPPTQLRQTNAIGHSAPGALTATCKPAGCGPYLVLDRTFRRDTAYMAVGWVKARARTRLRIVLGSTPEDVAAGPTVEGTGHWRRVSVTWTPQDRASHAVVTFQLISRGSAQLDIDDVEVGTREAVRAGGPNVSAAKYRVVSAPTPAGTLGAGDTAAWAVGGAAAGLLVGLAGAAAAIAADRNRQRDDEAVREETL